MKIMRAALLGLLAVALAAPAYSTGRELRMGPKNIPAKVREAAEAEYPGIKLDAVKLSRSENGFVYQVIGTAEGKRYAIDVDPDGNVLQVEEKDDGVGLGDVPAAAKKAALEALKDAHLVQARVMPAKGSSEAKLYAIEATKGGKEYEILVSAKGDVRSVREAKDKKKSGS